MPGQKSKRRAKPVRKAVTFETKSMPNLNDATHLISLALLNLKKQNVHLINNIKIPTRWLLTTEELTNKKKHLNRTASSEYFKKEPTDQELAEYINGMRKRFRQPPIPVSKPETKKTNVESKSIENNSTTEYESTDEDIHVFLPKRENMDRKVSTPEPKALTLETTSEKGEPSDEETPVVRKRQASPRRHKCDYCKNSYMDDKSLMKHIVNIHKVLVTSGKIKLNKKTTF